MLALWLSAEVRFMLLFLTLSRSADTLSTLAVISDSKISKRFLPTWPLTLVSMVLRDLTITVKHLACNGFCVQVYYFFLAYGLWFFFRLWDGIFFLFIFFLLPMPVAIENLGLNVSVANSLGKSWTCFRPFTTGFLFVWVSSFARQARARTRRASSRFMTGAGCSRMPGCLCARICHCFIDGSDRKVEIGGDRGTGVCCGTLLMEDTGYKDSAVEDCFISRNFRSPVFYVRPTSNSSNVHIQTLVWGFTSIITSV